MLRELLSLLPDVVARCAPGVAGACAALGVMLWLCGARFSRSVLSLTAVAAGTVIGMRLPQWRGWQILFPGSFGAHPALNGRVAVRRVCRPEPMRE